MAYHFLLNACSISWVTRTHRNTDGTACANRMLRMRRWLTDSLTNVLVHGKLVRPFLSILTASALKRKKTRLATVPITLIYIVVGQINEQFKTCKLQKTKSQSLGKKDSQDRPHNTPLRSGTMLRRNAGKYFYGQKEKTPFRRLRLQRRAEKSQ